VRRRRHPLATQPKQQLRQLPRLLVEMRRRQPVLLQLQTLQVHRLSKARRVLKTPLNPLAKFRAETQQRQEQQLHLLVATQLKQEPQPRQ
jgi:hypothetical protein